MYKNIIDSFLAREGYTLVAHFQIIIIPNKLFVHTFILIDYYNKCIVIIVIHFM